MSFSDRLAVMRAGRLEQVAPPEEAYLRPRTAFVASFLGTTNLVRGRGKGAVAATDLGDLPLVQPTTGPLLLSVRPENLVFDEHAGVEVEVTHRAFKGHDLTFRCRPLDREAGDGLIVQTGPECPVQVGDRVFLRVQGGAVPLEASPRRSP